MNWGILACVISSAIILSLSLTSLAAIGYNNAISSPIRASENRPVEKEGCKIWQYDQGYWTPLGLSSVIGYCRCARGWGCHCFIQGCGDYETYNYWYMVETWALTIVSVISGIGTFFLILAMIFVSEIVKCKTIGEKSKDGSYTSL